MKRIERLVEKCIDKDKSAWDEFIRIFQNLVYQTVKLRLSRSNFQFEPQDLEDITQNIFLDIWEKDKLRQIKDHSRIRSWLCILSQNYALDYIRKKGKFTYRLSFPMDSSFDTELTLEDILVSNLPNPIQEAEFNELKDTLDNLVNKLPARQQLIMKLNIFYQKTHKEIAQILGISVNSVSSIIMRVKQKFKRSLKEKGYNL